MEMLNDKVNARCYAALAVVRLFVYASEDRMQKKGHT